MKHLFFALWALLTMLLGGMALYTLLHQPSLNATADTLLVVYASFCLLQLIRAYFRPWGLLGPRRRSGYWLCLLLMPLALLPLQAAYQIWQQGAYVVEEDARVRFGIGVLRQLLVWLQELVGHLGPMLLLLLLGTLIAVLLWRMLRTQVVR